MNAILINKNLFCTHEMFNNPNQGQVIPCVVEKEGYHRERSKGEKIAQFPHSKYGNVPNAGKHKIWFKSFSNFIFEIIKNAKHFFKPSMQIKEDFNYVLDI